MRMHMIKAKQCSRGFIISLEPALSLLMLLMLIVALTNYYAPQPRSYSEVISKMHETDLWLVQDSLKYYNATPAAWAEYEWVKKEAT
ncbi:MAG: hypothetical protein QXU54_00640 [Candidatus Micrarchaeia archaeon]